MVDNSAVDIYEYWNEISGPATHMRQFEYYRWPGPVPLAAALAEGSRIPLAAS